MTGFADWLAICDLKARYCRLLDTKDWAGFAEVYAEDVILDTTASGGPRIEGRAAVLAMVQASLAGAVTVHQVHSPEIAVDGDGAKGIWAMYDRLRWPNGRALDGAGHYHELYARRDGVWRIAESRLTRLYVDLQPPREEKTR